MERSFGLDLESVTLGDRVGQGVSGQVFRGLHAASGTPVAVKVYELSAIDPAFRARERFWRECRILSRVGHPAFPSLYGCGEIDSATAFAVMEWIEGKPLGAYRNAPLEQVLHLALGIALGLRAFHRSGFVHRDIAFDNFLVEERPWGPNPRIIDLGVANESEPAEELTHPGSFFGRMAFAAPEGLGPRGSEAVDDPRSDVFSFGVLLFEWLCGQNPFPGATPPEIFRSQQRELPDRLPVNGGRPAVAQELSDFVLGLLEKDMDRRPSIETVVRELVELRRSMTRVRRAATSGDPAGLVFNAADAGYLVSPRAFPKRASLQPLTDLSEFVGSSPAVPIALTPGEAARARTGQPTAPPAPPAPVLKEVLGEIGKHPIGSRLFVAFGAATFVTACVLVYLLMRSR